LKGGCVETCVLTDADKRFQGLDWCEVQEYFAQKKLAAKAAEPDRQQADARFHTKAKGIVAEAKRMNSVALTNDDRSNRSRTQGINDTRKSLKLYERKQRMKDSSSKNKPNDPAQVIAIGKIEKATSSEGYIPPARPYSMIRKAREEAKRHGK
jgi:hypothetical protein